MFSKTTVLFFLSFFAILAAAVPGGHPSPTKTITVAATPTATTISQCNTGDAQCCNDFGAAKSLPGISQILGLLGIALQDLSVIVGTNCSPITLIGLGQGGNCRQKPVCCSNNNFKGLINLGCVPITL